MAISYQHPKVKVHVGDGFKFLDDYKNEFDVIITDSSDPEGPAESLFQKPYFELLFGALKEGGVITTQGCTFSFVCGAKWFFYFRIYFCSPSGLGTLAISYAAFSFLWSASVLASVYMFLAARFTQ